LVSHPLTERFVRHSPGYDFRVAADCHPMHFVIDCNDPPASKSVGFFGSAFPDLTDF
jgi:hypothetical protein